MLQGSVRITLVLGGALLLLSTRATAADRQIRPFFGATFGGGTTFVDLENAVGKPNVTIGATAVFLGELLGAEVDVADAPGFFESGDKHLVLTSRVTTVTGNFVVAAPHRMTEYSLRPYLIGGAGVMQVRTTTSLGVFDLSRTIPHWDVGVGAVGFVTNRIGVSWDVRRFQSIGKEPGSGGSFGDEQLSFWRATMAVVMRY
jgi:hypothetical protein